MPQQSKYFWWSLLSSLAVAGIYAFAEQENFSWRLAFVLGLVAAPLVLQLRVGQRSFRYLWPSLLLIGSLFFIRSSTIFYFGSGFAILFFWEASIGKRSWLAPCLLAVMSPFVGNMAYLWSFPIRLQLSQLATRALRFIGVDAQAAGNLVVLDGQEFSVDSACMGLQMLVTALILAIFLLARVERFQKRAFSIFTLSFNLLLMLALAVGANFIRLLALIVFRILPDNPFHDLLGLLSLGLYAILPFYFSWNWRMKSILPSGEGRPIQSPPNWQLALYPAVLISLLFVGFQFRQAPIISNLNLNELDIPGYYSQLSESGVIKLTNPEALVYLKPPVRPFQGGHDPRICWQGSGYEFTQIDTRQKAGYTIYQAILQQVDDQLYTAWWYDSGSTKTVSEWKWRWASLRQQERFYLVNVTCGSEVELEQKLEEWLMSERFGVDVK